MSTEMAYVTQVASIIGFLILLFVLYRSLVSQKEATIELLKQQVALLKEHLEVARNSSPDVIARRLAERVGLLTAELDRLQQDKAVARGEIEAKANELTCARNELAQLERQLKRAHEIAEEYFCPTCKAPMSLREVHTEVVEYGGHDVDLDHELVVYECGLEYADHRKISPCGREKELSVPSATTDQP